MSDAAEKPAAAVAPSPAPASDGAAKAASPPPAAAATPSPAPAKAATPAGDAATPGKPASAGTGNFKDNFKTFSKFGDSKSDGKLITLSQSDKWMKQAGVIDGKKITTTDTGIYFKKFKSLKIGIEDYGKFLEELAKSKKIEAADLKTKMAGCGTPGLTGTNKPKQQQQQQQQQSGANKAPTGAKVGRRPTGAATPVTAAGAGTNE